MLQRLRFLWSGKTPVEQKRFTKISDEAYEFRDAYGHAPVVLMDKQYAFFNLELASLRANQSVNCDYAKDSWMLVERKVAPSGATWNHTFSITATGMLRRGVEIIDAKKGTPTSFRSVEVTITPEDPEELLELADNLSTITGSEVMVDDLKSPSDSTGFFQHIKGDAPDINYDGSSPKLELHIRIPKAYFTSVWQSVFSIQSGWAKAFLGFQTECFVGDMHYEDIYAMENDSYASVFFEYLHLSPKHSTVGPDES